MNEPNDTPDIEALRAKLMRLLEHARQLKLENDAAEKSLISRADAKHELQAEFLIVEEMVEQIHKKCVAQFVDIVSPEVAEAMSKEIQTELDDALNELREEFIAIVHSFKADDEAS
jgi:Ni,Fe-hydrogenase maturation factor